MGCIDQKITERYCIYNGDCVEVIRKIPDKSIGLTIYSPPFCGLYNYSSDKRDMSNSVTYEDFFKHYSYLVPEIERITQAGRICAVHCMDIPNPGQKTGIFDLPGRLIKIHSKFGFYFVGRIAIWKEPLRVTIRTRLKHLTHKQLVKDSCQSFVAGGDYLLLFQKKGGNLNPVQHKSGFEEYIGGREIPNQLMKYKGEKIQKLNKLSHWIWRNYASCFWDDIRIDNVLPYKSAKDIEDEKHIHPLQLDVIERCIIMWSNKEDIVFTPFMGVGSEIYGALKYDRRGIGIELKQSYYRQAIRNIMEIGVKGKLITPSGFFLSKK